MRNKENKTAVKEFVRQIYQANPSVLNHQVLECVRILLGLPWLPTAGTLATWRTEFREQGIEIPDGRQK